MKRLFYCLPILFCLACSDPMGDTVLDSEALSTEIVDLEAMLNTDINDETRLAIYAKLGKLLKNSDTEKAFYYMDEQLSLANDIGNLEYQGRAYHGKGLLYRRGGDYEAAISAYLHAVDLFKEGNQLGWLADDLNNIGFIFIWAEGYDEAIPYFEKAIDQYNEIGDYAYMANPLINLAICYSKKETPDLKLAEATFDKAINIGKQYGKGDYKLLADLYNEKGRVFSDGNQYQEAIDAYEKAYSYAATGDFSEIEANAYYNIAEVYMYMGKEHYEEANSWLEKAEALSNAESSNTDLMIMRYNIAGELKHRMGQYEEAIAIYNQAINMANTEVVNEPLQQTLELLGQSQRMITESGVELSYTDIFAAQDLKDQQARLTMDMKETINKPALKVALTKAVEDYEVGMKQAKIESGWLLAIKVAVLVIIALSIVLVTVRQIAQRRENNYKQRIATIRSIAHDGLNRNL